MNYYDVTSELNHNLFVIYCIHMRVVDFYSAENTVVPVYLKRNQNHPEYSYLANKVFNRLLKFKSLAMTYQSIFD